MKRREFLKVAGVSVAGTAIAHSLLTSCGKDKGTTTPPISPSEKPKGHFELWQLTPATDTICNSYLLKTKEGNLIVIDGGNESNGDADKLRGWIKAKGGNKVKAWWFTHPHGDHIGAFMNISNDLQGIEIDTIYYSRVADSISEGRTLTNRFNDRLAVMEQAGVNVVNLNLGGRYDLDGIFIKVLGIANPEFTTAAEGTSVINEQSVIIRFEDDSKSVVITGDASDQAGTKALTKYSKYLDCDYLQMGHHGQRGLRQSFYKAVTFKHCLWPTPKWLWETTEQDNIDGTKPYKTWQTRQWVAEKGIPDENNHVAWRDIDWHLA